MKNIEKNCLQSLRRQNKFLAYTIVCAKELVCILFPEVHKLKNVCRG